MYIAYLYSSSGAVSSQIFDLNNFECEMKINDVSTASFSLFKDSPCVSKEILKSFAKIKIFSLESGTEKLLISWYITEVKAFLHKVDIKISSEEIVLKKRISTIKVQSYNNIDTIINTILSWVNSRTGDNFSLNSSVSENLYMDIKWWMSLFYILKYLAKSKYRFKVEDNIIFFEEIIGLDRSYWDNYFEYSFSSVDPDSRNIKHLETVTDYDSQYNALFLYSSGAYINSSVSQAFLLEGVKTYKDLDFNVLSSFLDKSKNPQVWYKVVPMADDFFEVWIWDIVKVKVDAWNDFLFIDESLEVTSKSIGVKWEISFVLSSWSVRGGSVSNRLEMLEDAIKTSEM